MTDASKKTPTQAGSERYGRLTRELALLATQMGFVLPGSVQTRFFECTRPGHCRCHDNPANRHGPYHYWIRRVHGKTVNISLTDEQLAIAREWIENWRRLDRLVQEMRQESLRAFAVLSGTTGKKLDLLRRR